MDRNKLIIEWHSLLKDLIKNAWVVVLTVLIVYMGIYVAEYMLYSPQYTSSATLVVNVKSSTGNSFTGYTTSSEMAGVYTNIFTEPTMKERAAEYMNADRFSGTISASVMDQTNFIKLSVTSDSPRKSYEHLQAVLAVYPQISENVFDNAVITVLTPPSVPKSASNAVSSSDSSLIVSGAAVVMTFLIVLLSLVRDTVKNESAFEAKIDGKLLECIPHEKKNMSLKEYINKQKKSLLISGNAFVSLGFVEKFHVIASKLEYIKKNSGSKVFAVTSVAENEGKSTIASNIALSLAERGNKVALIDFDGKKPALYKIFQEEANESFDLGYVFDEANPDAQLRLKKYKKTSLYLALNTKAYRDYHKWIKSPKCKEAMEKVKENVDFVIVDTAPMTADSAITDMAEIVDETILVVRTDVVKAPVINDVIETIGEVGGVLTGCILNDTYPDFVPFKMSGYDESGYYNKKYGKYNYYYDRGSSEN